jgi:hypothetical protein
MTAITVGAIYAQNRSNPQESKMKKIVSLFQRNYEGDRLVRDDVVPGAEWVARGEGRATLKLDGTCCAVIDGVFYKRYDAKKGKTPPEGFKAAQDPDPVTGHWPGWLPVGDSPADKWHQEAFSIRHFEDGTYELCGPKVQGNSLRLAVHSLFPHGEITLSDVPRDFEGLKTYLKDFSGEGVVWHHEDGRMVKIKRKDFYK